MAHIHEVLRPALSLGSGMGTAPPVGGGHRENQYIIGGYVFTGSVDAKNVFGAKITSMYTRKAVCDAAGVEIVSFNGLSCSQIPAVVIAC
jgi:hypothetical protein